MDSGGRATQSVFLNFKTFFLFEWDRLEDTLCVEIWNSLIFFRNLHLFNSAFVTFLEEDAHFLRLSSLAKWQGSKLVGSNWHYLWKAAKWQKAATIFLFTILVLVPVYPPTRTAVNKHFILVSLHNDALETLTTW